jgi:hypothetical protein
MGYSDRGTPGQITGQDLVGTVRQDIERSIAQALAKGVATSTIAVDEPTPCTPDFVLGYIVEGDKIFPNMCASIPTAAELLKTWIIRDADCVDQATFDSSQKVSENTPDADARAANHFEYIWDGKPLQPETLYRLIYLVVSTETGKVRNPVDDLAFNAAPLATFTTPAIFGVPSSPNASLILFNRLDPTTKEYDAEAGFRVYAPLTTGGAAQTWGASGASEVVVTLTRTSDSVLLKFPHVLSGVELTQVDAASTPANRGYVDIVAKGLAPGAAMQWTNNIAWLNGLKKVSTGGAVSFNAAGFQTDPANLTSLSLTITSATDPYTADFARIVLNFTQPSTVVALKWVKLERKLTAESDSAYEVVTDPNKLTLRDDEFHTAGAKTVLLREGLKTKPSKSYTLRVTITALGLTQVQFTQGFSTGANGAVATDTAVPTLSTNPDTGTTGPTVSERHSKIDVSIVLPSANINTLDNYQVILSTSNVAPNPVDPVVGDDGVLVIKYGQNVTFNLSYFADFGDQFWVFFRAHNSVGYSSWSAATNQDGYSRPLQDFIGDAVPDNSEGLIRAGTGGTGNTTTTFKLDGSASAVDDFYNGNALHLSTFPADGDTWRTITDYNGTTKVCTVDTAYSSAPSDGSSFDIHAIDVSGDRASKSGTGHTTTTFVLDSGASGSDDFYLGYTVYIPTLATASDRIRKVVDYVGSTKTLTVEPAFGTAPSGNLGYLLVNGSIGFSSASNADSLTGIASPVPFRWYLNDADVLVFEILPPTGQNAFSLTHFQIQAKRRSTNALRDDSGAIAIASGTGYTTKAAPSGTFWASAIRFRNMFRDTGVDGWGIYSYFVAVLNVDGSPNYDPDKSGSTVVIDYQGIDSYPVDRYPDYL